MVHLRAGGDVMSGAIQMLINKSSGGGGALAVGISPSMVNTTRHATGFNSPSVTAIASGGSPAYSYAWTKLSGGAIICASPSSSITLFSVSSMFDGETRTATFRMTVTDSLAATAVSDIVIMMTRNSIFIDPGNP